MSTVTITTGSGLTPEEDLKALILRDTVPNPEQMLEAADHQIDRIRYRTGNGSDVNGEPFAPYSQSYYQKRGKEGFEPTNPDLRVTGKLLDSLEASIVSPTSFAITITDDEAAVYATAINNGLGNQPMRRFFDTSAEELRMIAEDLKEN